MRKYLISFFLIIVFLTPSPWNPSLITNQAYALDKVALPKSEIILLSEKATRIETISLNFNVDQVQWKFSEKGMSLELNDLPPLYIPGKPMLPYKNHHIPLKPGEELAYIKTIHIESFSFPPFKFPVEVAPEPHTIDKKSYNYHESLNDSFSQRLFPMENFELVHNSTINNNKLNLFVYPVYTYHNQWHLATDIKIEIGFYSKQASRAFSLIENNELVKHAVILTPDELNNSALQLKSIQEKDGYKVRVVKLSELKDLPMAVVPEMASIKGFNDFEDEEKKRFLSYDYELASKIRTYLIQQLEAGAIHYLTIFGDASYVPPSYYVFSNDGMGDYDQWVPTDYFYMSPLSQGEKYAFDINIGRLPVRNQKEASAMIDKIQRYRKALNPSWFHKAKLMGGDPFNGDYFAELAMNRSINLDYFHGVDIEKYYKTEAKFSTEKVLEGFSEANAGFIWAFGHGSGDGLALEPGFIDSKQIMDLPKKDQLPIYVSEACGNGAYDSRLAQPSFGTNKEHPYPTSFAEAVLLSPGGGIAYIGGARINYAGWSLRYNRGIPNLRYVYYMDAMIEYLHKNFSSMETTLGDVVRQTMSDYIEEEWYWINAPQIKTFFGFTLLGDPTIILPQANKKTKPSEIPEVKYKEDMPLSSKQIPLFSMDDGIQVSAKTDSKKIRYIISDYLDHDTPLRMDGYLQQKSYQEYEHFFTPDKKTLMSIRIETEDFKENRIVFYSRYNYDLVLYSENDLTLLQQNEKKDYIFRVANEGIYDATKIHIDILKENTAIQNYFIDFFPIMSSRSFNFSFSSEELGDIEVKVRTPQIKGETVTNDNEINYQMRIMDTPITRIGILQESYVNQRAYYEERLMINKLNKHFRDHNQAIEVCVIPFASDLSQQTTMDRLNIDMLVLYTPFFYDFPFQEALYYLEQFENKGGIVLGVLNLGINHFGFPLNDVQEYFGIDRNEKFEMKSTPEYFVNFNLLQQNNPPFSKNSYQLPCRYTLMMDKPWSDVSLNGAELMGLSEDNRIALIKYGSRYLYSGFLSEIDFQENDDALAFFVDILSLPSLERMDAYLSSAYFGQLTGYATTPDHLTVVYQNTGNVKLEGMTLMVNHQEEYPLDDLEPNEKGVYNLPVVFDSTFGELDYHLEIKLSSKQHDRNLNNNIKTVKHFVQSDNTPEYQPELVIHGSLHRATLKTHEILSGKITPGASLHVNEQMIPCNDDGSFSIMLPLSHGVQEYHFIAKHGSMQSDIKKVTINCQKQQQIKLLIGDSTAIFDDKIGDIGEEVPRIFMSLTYVPLRLISEFFQAKVEFVQATQTLIINYKEKTITMKYLEKKATVKTPDNTYTVELQGPYMIWHGRSFVPVRFIAETFEAKVDWNASLEMVTITKNITLPDVIPSPIKFIEKSPSKRDFYTTIVDGDTNNQLIRPTCIDSMDDGSLLISSFDSIYHWDLKNEPQKLYSISEWKAQYFDMYYFDRSNSFANRSIFKRWKDKLVFTDRYDIYIIDPQNNSMVSMISFIDFGTYLYPNVKYSAIYSFQIIDDLAYLLSPFFGITVIDLNTEQVVNQYRIPDLPYDFTINGDLLTTVSLFGNMHTISLSTGRIKFYEFPDFVFVSTMTQKQNKYYIQTLIPSQIYEVTISSEGIQADSYRFSTSSDICAEQILQLPQGNYALIYDLTTMDSGIAQLKQDFSMDKNNLSDNKAWTKNNPKFSLFSSRVWMVDTEHALVTQRSPGDTTSIKLYQIHEQKLIKDIPVRLDSSYASIMDIQYAGNKTIYALIDNRGLEIQRIQFENLNRIRYMTTRLTFSTEDYYPYYWAVDGEHACIWDYLTADHIIFNLKTGEEVLRYPTYDLSMKPSYLSTGRMIRFHQQKIYLFDVLNGLVRVFDSKGNAMHQWDISSSMSGLPGLYSDFKVLSDNTFALLDYNRSQYQLFVDGYLTQVWGNKGIIEESANYDSTFLGPLSMDIYNDQLLINDSGNFRVIQISLENERYLKPKMMVWPHEINVNVEFPYELSFHINVHRVDDDTPLFLIHPFGISCLPWEVNSKSSVLEWQLQKNFLETNSSIIDEITIRSDKVEITIPIRIERNPVSIDITPGEIQKGLQKIYPPIRSKFEGHLFMIELETIENIFGFECKVFNEDLIINLPNEILILKANESKGRLFDHQGMTYMDLGQKVIISKGHYLIPLNSILKHLNIRYDVKNKRATLAWTLPYEA